MRFFATKTLLLILLLTVISIGTGSANLAESKSVADPLSSAFFYEEFDNDYFSGIRIKRFVKLTAEPLLIDFSGLTYDALLQGKGQLTKERLMSFLWLHNTTLSFTDVNELAALYISEAEQEGINHDIAFSQMCLETGFLKFGGDVQKYQYNYCGLGATGNGVSGLSFSSPKEGVRAHIQHLKAYASTEKLNNALVDSRFNYVKRGSVKTYEDLTGKWAVDPHYHYKLRSILQRLYSGSYANTGKLSDNSGT